MIVVRATVHIEIMTGVDCLVRAAVEALPLGLLVLGRLGVTLKPITDGGEGVAADPVLSQLPYLLAELGTEDAPCSRARKLSSNQSDAPARAGSAKVGGALPARRTNRLGRGRLVLAGVRAP